MSTGPIDFVRTENVDTLGETEYGGGPGLVQGQPNGRQPVEASVHLEHLSVSERRGALVRAKSSVTEEREVDSDGVTTIVRTVHADGVDPLTGLTLEDHVQSEEASESTRPVL